MLVLTRPLPPHPHVLSPPMASLRNYRVPLYNNSTMPNPEQGKRSTTTPHNDEKWPPILRRRYRFLFHRRPIADEPHGLGRSFAVLLMDFDQLSLHRISLRLSTLILTLVLAALPSIVTLFLSCVEFYFYLGYIFFSGSGLGISFDIV